MKNAKSKYLQGKVIRPDPIQGNISITELVDNYFTAYNAARLKEACHLYVHKMLEDDVTIGLSITGAMTPAGLGMACIVPLIEAGFVDWIASTGANLYHDTHYAMGMELRQGSPFIDDLSLKKEKVVRIYDILFDFQVLLSTDRFYREILSSSEFQKEMGGAELHFLIGKFLFERERILGLKGSSILAAAYQTGLPIYNPSPGDSSIWLNAALLTFQDNKLKLDISLDVNETAAIVLSAKRNYGKSGVFIIGGGAPKNFLLQTEPQIQEVMGIEEAGHDYFLQITDARPDTGGLSGATPSEAVSWGKVDPEMLPNAVVAYLDASVALPIITSYALSHRKRRPYKRLYDKRKEMVAQLKAEYLKASQKAPRRD